MASPSHKDHSTKEKLLLKLRVGHRSQVLPGGHPKSHTHKWTVYVKSMEGCPPLDSQLLKKALFQLHPDYPNRDREVKSPPFEVSETGYAGFEIPISLTFATGTVREISYDMYLTFDPTGGHSHEQVLEFKDPKPQLRNELLRFKSVVHSKGGTKPKNVSTEKHASTIPSKSTTGKLHAPTGVTAPESPGRKRTDSPIAPGAATDAKHTRSDHHHQKHKIRADKTMPNQQKHIRNKKPSPLNLLLVDTNGGTSCNSAPMSPREDDGRAQNLSSNDSQQRPRRPSSNNSGELVSPQSTTSNSSKPINGELVKQLAMDFGADETDASALAEKSKMAAAAARAQSPIFTADSSPDSSPNPTEQPPCSSSSKTTAEPHVVRRPSIAGKVVPGKGHNKHRENSSPNKSPHRTNTHHHHRHHKTTPSTHQWSDADLTRLTELQRKIMTMSDSDTVLKVAKLIKANVPVKIDSASTAMDFDLCLLKASTIAELEKVLDGSQRL